FINLATAQALKRSKEVGVRKVIGGTKGQLFWQFISETGLITLIGVVLSVLIVEPILPSLNNWVYESAGLNLFGNLTLFSDLPMILFLVVLMLIVTLFSGSYPGLVLAGFQPVAALKGKISTQQVGGLSVRRSLVVVQFILTQILIIGAIVITQQMDFFRGKDIGYDPSAVVMINLPIPDKVSESLRHRFLQVPGVERVSFAFSAPTSQSNNTTNHRFDTRQEYEKWSVNTKPADSHYLETYGLKLIAGKNIPDSDTTRGFLVNETYVKRLGQNLKPADVVGRNLNVWGRTAPIYGVIKDWNNLSLHNEIQPIAVFAYQSKFLNAAMKVNTAHLPQTLAGIEQIWNENFPDYLYDQTFLDQRIAQAYQTENLILQLIRAFSCIAIVIGCLGLYGLVSFMAAQKTKEIGVRKVLGASVTQILGLFGKEFGKLVSIAFAVAAPLGWWLMSQWLEDYTYRISIGWQVFVAAIIITAIIATLTVGWQSFRAATTNPAKSLKSE
ncbi:MAG: FtsX-like permease family protein, partial [Siphonobacter sp.]